MRMKELVLTVGVCICLPSFLLFLLPSPPLFLPFLPYFLLSFLPLSPAPLHPSVTPRPHHLLNLPLSSLTSLSPLLPSLQEQFKVDPEGGLTNLLYQVESRQELTISGAPCTIINTKLECDPSLTPWCLLA